FAIVALIAILGTALFTPLSIKLAWKIDAIDYPDGRRVNTKPIPRLGGVAVFAGLVLSLGFVVVLNLIWPDILHIRSINTDINYLGVGLAITVIFAIGFLDDVLQIKPYIKFLGHIVAASIACASGVLFSHFLNPFGPGVIDIGIMAYPVTVFYLVAFANIINLIDGLDGLAAGIVAICAAALLVLSFSRGYVDATIVGLAVVGVCAGFLVYNFYPARVFLGDSGSLVLGFCLGLVSLFGVVRTTALISLLIPVVIAGIPVIDTFTSIVRRIRLKQPIYRADKAHVHHRFISLGFSQRTTVLIIYGISIVLSVLAILIVQDTSPLRFVYVGALVVIVTLFIWRLGLLSSVLTHHYERRQTPKRKKEELREKKEE
ncbi:MAG: undecaprenyl/decaprenyl-phosphate alpha-N-acetylglucosaminyl 1-phosphate transferase, partial [Coriobacteriia bacterium]|nr:undecaprenyl/decaprenyl-phosphate alpha-N-acetylglucosaminyl 1-phosphate transferase [Coriobacteriia bacterium]